MNSGTSGGSMQSGSSREDDQNDTSSFFSTGLASISRLHQLPQTHLNQQSSFSSQQHLHDHYPNSLTSINSTTRSDHDNNISGYNNPNPHLSSTNSLFLETLPQSDLDKIWSISMNVNNPNNPHSHNHHHHQQQQQMFYTSTTSSLEPSTSAMKPNQAQTTHQDLQPIPIGKIPSVAPGRAVKKRTRASRKTPTTVLTTDTTNFRAMVQEFTGIPTPPFGPSSLFPTKKFDLFGTNNGLDHPSLGSLLFSLNKSTNNTNPNPSQFAHPSISTASPIAPFATERNQNSHTNPYQHHSQQTMLPQGSNSTFLNQPQGSNDHIKNPNIAFHHSSSIPQRPPFPSKYSNLGNKDDQLGAFSNVERGENDNISRTS